VTDQSMQPICLRSAASRSGLERREFFQAAMGKEDQAFARIAVETPDFVIGSYFAAIQKHAINPSLDVWPDGYNQLHALPVRGFSCLKRGGLFLLLQLSAEEYLAILPITAGRTVAWLEGRNGKLELCLSHFGAEPFTGTAPAMAWAFGPTAYAAARSAWQECWQASELSEISAPRETKAFPEPLRYLGWCSWEAFKQEIDEQRLLDVIRGLKQRGLPVRWVLVDDGHLDQRFESGEESVSSEGGELPTDSASRKLASLLPDQTRFPRGWKPLLAERDTASLRWFGVWLNMNGYWGGIAAKHQLGDLGASIETFGDGTRLPGPSRNQVEAFYQGMLEAQAEAGFDFVKVDHQAHNLFFHVGQVANAVERSRWSSQALEQACRDRGLGLINCMAHGPVCIWNARWSAVTRCSEDYKAEDLNRAKLHLHNSYANMLVLGQSVWGDHDMFHTSDAVAGPIMARSKALSGGPVYLSDLPEQIIADSIRPLCFEDGEILRPLAPAVSLPESVFIDPYEDGEPFRVVAPLAHGCSAVAVYNLTRPERPVTGWIAREDYPQAAALCSEWEPSEGPVVAYDCETGTAFVLDSKRHEFELSRFGDRLFILAPVVEGWAVIGRPDKFISPQAVEAIEATERSLRVVLRESGPLLIWRNGPVHCETFPVVRAGASLWRIDAPVEQRPLVVSVTTTE
jgi:hypothetical protein